MKSATPKLREMGYQVLAEVQLVAGGQIDMVAWNDREMLLVEAKCPASVSAPGRLDLRSVATGLGQILVYRELVEAKPGAWFDRLDREVLTYRGDSWRSALVSPMRWAILLCCRDRATYWTIERSATRIDAEMWCWLPPGQLDLGTPP